MIKMVFIYNDMLDTDVLAELKLPMTFVAFAMVDAKMYTHYQNKGVFIVPHTFRGVRGNTKVYGALYVCKDIEFYIDTIDAYHGCSRSKLYRNHIKDLHHRVEVEAVPIFFDSLDDLARLKYREGMEVTAFAYFGNINHPRIRTRFTQRRVSRRVMDGVYKDKFVKLFGRVKNEL